MALGFIKKVFTFGKDKPSERGVPSETGVDAGLSAEEKAAIAAESEPHDRVEQLPLAEDPVLAEEVDTAGGPSDDLAEDQAGEDDVTADDLSLLPLSLLEAEEAAEEHPSDVTPSFDELLDEAEGASPGTEIALPRGFSTVVEPQPEPETPEVKQSWFQRLKAGLFRTSSQLTGQISALFTKRKLDEETLEELEDLLIQADLGVETAMRVTGTLSSERYGKDVTGEDVTRIMAAEIVKVLKPVAKPLALDLNHKPHVILVVGVNGTGKTTTIGKLAAKLSGSGLKVMLAAGDTFRAAAIEQLKIWADRTGSTFIGTKLGADAAGLAYDAFEKARAEKSDVLIIDTAGRLQNKTELMDELEKIVRVLSKLDPDAPHTVLQTLDATTGQNAMNQVEIFRNVAGVNGLIMTKLDGTARGGILVAIAAKHKLPVYFIGVGEGVDDLEPFEAEDFARAIAGFGPSS
ncbi:signal recognition particle-docking protein FtsY [Agrobacterium vitis]|uniref:signal recognition particle-docking protein FtsY n=1 Tax=Agrobacterium vitis TaxID=373 RepID=UPI001F326FED|nr:signal recognition particle-docking protein FtsY [Agrobacterium vitis]MCF1468066.1 signal recognition particle-docking protein FtsY [Agrobacterium vitis]